MKSVLFHIASYITQSRSVSSAIRAVGRTGLLPRAVGRRLPTHHPVTIRSVDCSFTYKTYAGDRIGRPLAWIGLAAYEPEVIPTFIQVVKRADMFIDIGANTGLFSLIACGANASIQVLAFEPLSIAYEKLEENINLNHWQDRITPSNSAIGNSDGVAKFHIPIVSGIPTSASLGTNGFRGKKGTVIEVQVHRLDSCDIPACTRPCIKIDVEGHEHEALLGMQRFIENTKPTIFFECHPDGPAKQIESALRPHSYSFSRLRQSGATSCDGLSDNLSAAEYNWVAVPLSRV